MSCPQTLHLHGVADGLASWLPSGLAGGVGMVRNWLFTIFYCMSELWGDVVLSLLFWGLANETTALHDASLLYPLFGIGANIGQVRVHVRDSKISPIARRTPALL